MRARRGLRVELGKFNLFLETDAVANSDFGYARTAGELKFRIAASSFGEQRDQPSIGIGFQLQDRAQQQRDQIPSSGHLIRTAT